MIRKYRLAKRLRLGKNLIEESKTIKNVVFVKINTKKKISNLMN